MKLITNLNTALKNLSTTRFLKLAIDDVIPQDIQSLIFLEELHLKGDFKKCELDFSQFKELKVLTLNSPYLETFPHQALLAPRLSNLKIIEGKFTSIQLPLEIISPLRSFTIKDTSLMELPLEFSQFRELVELNLSGNKLSILPPSFEELGKLSRLNIDHNAFEKLDNVLKRCPSLRHLSCDGNPFTEEEKYRIQREFNLYPQ